MSALCQQFRRFIQNHLKREPARWRVVLTGHKHDLMDLVEGVSTPDAKVVWADDGKCYLYSKLFQQLTEPRLVHERATQLAAMLDGAASLTQSKHRPVQAGSVGREHPDGRTDAFILAESAELRIRVGMTMVVSGAPPSDPPPPELNASITDALGNDDVGYVLQLLREPGWVELYNVFEILRQNGATAPETSGVSNSAWTRFKRTANALHRHAPGEHEPPAKPLELDEGRAVIRKAVNGWLRSRRTDT